ncbi:bifunctional (p)ppGpp synthetase/guanosine-3',5'-bis(diphosphate) 3'-pyrophosphohydrolase [Candidatus Gracilibacteria bacterium 28_42_T64]|nr:bifunctional (p)ppGpp synthetase/guanosine-3',5'-bis(diphosphate) 3'-pyrophosphohydrolase [Candidatus Gracilibacteria bacterium 28_42_T64]
MIGEYILKHQINIMEGIILKNKSYQKKFDSILLKYGDELSVNNLTQLKIVIIRFKKYSNNEYFILFALKYILCFFKVIDYRNPIITKRDRKKVKKVIQIYTYPMNGYFEKYIYTLMNIDKDFLLFNIILKYSALLGEDKYMALLGEDKNMGAIWNKEKYFKSCGYMLPYLTLTESRLLPFFQDIYFKKIYPKEYRETKKCDLQKGSNYEIPGGYHIEVVNDLSHLMTEAQVLAQTQIRKKTYFSLYNKMQRKNRDTVSDSIGVRIIFKKQDDLYKFIYVFENKFVHITKKDYIINPKPNGYQSIHYKYINPYRNGEVLVELQLRTLEMDNNIQNRSEVSHFTYTVKQHKWAPLFTEVHDGYKYMLQFMEKKHKN